MAEKLTLRSRLILGATVAVVLPFLLAGIIIYVQLTDSLTRLAEGKALHVAEDLAEFLDAALRQELRLAESIAADEDIVQAGKTGDYRKARREIDAILDRVGGGIFTIFITDRNGIDRVDPRFPQQVGLDLSDREYFRKARAGRANVTEPFMPRGTASPDKPLMMVCAPIQDGGDFLGIVSVAFRTDFLAGQVTAERFNDAGYAYLLNEEGLVLVHPRKDFILNIRLFDHSGTEALAGLVRTKKNGTTRYFFDGSERIAGVARVGMTGWTAVFDQNLAEVMAPVRRTLISIFIGGAALLSIAVILIIIYFSRISHPIQKSLDMMRQVSRHSSELLVQIGLDRKIVYANPAYEKVTGMGAEALLGTEPNFAGANVPPEAIWAQIESGNPWFGRIGLPGNGNEALFLEVMLAPLPDNRGHVQGYLEIGRDVTREVRFEKRLIQSQKMEAIGTMAGGIAHDFNNILGGIFGYAEIMLLNHQGNPEAEKNIRAILRASERARELIGQILTFSRQTEIELRPLSPRRIFEEALHLLRAAVPKHIDIQMDLQSESTVLADSIHLHQIVMNLVTNAAHAIGDSPGVIRVQLEDFRVDEAFVQTRPGLAPGDHVLLRVSDTGRGMDSEIIDQIFEPFFTTKPAGEGTGLGLSVVHGIVKKFNGVIFAYSEAGQGTTINILVPCSGADDSNSRSDVSAIAGGTERLIIVDNEPAIAETMTTILTRVGYRVTVFADGQEALAAVTDNPDRFDLMITDHTMPKVTGLELAKRIRQAGIGIPVILATGYLSREVENAARNAGVSATIAKPVNAYRLSRAIRNVL